MDFLSIETNPLGLNLVVFAAAGVVVWLAGSRLGQYGKVVAERTRAGEAFIGTLLIGAVVSLPEMVIALTASFMGVPKLAVNTLLGGIVFAILILALTDAAIGKEPLSSDIKRPVVPLQGVLVILLLALTAAGVLMGDVPVFGVGGWSMGLLALYLLIIVLVKQTQKRGAWVVRESADSENRHVHAKRRSFEQAERRSSTRIVFLTIAAAVAILVAGVIAAQTADALSKQTALGASFAGFLLGGIVTSLPEVSSTLAAVRLQQYEMAFSDAFGTNLFSVMLLFFCDVVYAGGPILNEVDRFSLFATTHKADNRTAALKRWKKHEVNETIERTTGRAMRIVNGARRAA